MNSERVLFGGATSGVMPMVAVLLMSVSSVCAQCETHKLIADDGSGTDYFGRSVAMSGDTVLIGAPKVDYIGFDMGAAYVFRLNGAEWEQAPRLVAADATLGDNSDHMGDRGVAIDGDTAVIGAYNDYLAPYREGIQMGSAYVFQFNGSEWVQQQKLMPSDGEAGDRFGWAVAVDGNTIAIGSREDNDNGNGAGAVYIYEFDGNTWVERQKLLGAKGKTLNPSLFGNAVALDGDRMLVGAPYDDTISADNGAAYTYRRQDGVWTLEQLVAPNKGGIPLIFSLYGWSVALEGEVMVIGAHGLFTGGSSGAAFVFRFDGSNWVQEQKLLSPKFVPFGDFGKSVAVSGDTALMGEPGANESIGAAHVFTFNGAAWAATAELVGSDANDPDFGGTPPYFGLALSLVGSTAVIASPYHDTVQNGGDSGGVYLFDLDQVNCDPPCPWDLDDDDVVGAPDLLLLLGAWGTDPGGPPDFNGDGNVGAADLIELLGNWGPCP